MFIKCVLGVNTCGREGKEAGVDRGRSRPAKQAQWQLRATPQVAVWLKWPIKVVLYWAQMARPLYPLAFQGVGLCSPGGLWRGGGAATALPEVGASSPSLKGALGSAAPCLPQALTFEKHFLHVRPGLGCVRVCCITQFLQHSEVQVVFYILHMRKLGLCLFFLMKTQHGAMFYGWPTTRSSLPADVEKASQLFTGECQKFGLEVLLLTSFYTLR